MARSHPADRDVAVLTATLAILGVGAAVGAATMRGAPPAAPASIALSFALLTAGEALVVRMRLRGEVLALTLFEALLLPVLFNTPVVVAAGLVALAQIAAGMIHRIQTRKIAFNVAQWVAATAVGGTVLTLLRDGEAFDAENFLALGVTIVTIAAINIASFVFLMHLVQQRPIAAVARSVLPSIGAGWTVNASFAVLFVAASGLGARAIPFYVVPLLALHWGSRGLAAAAADVERMQGMHRALRSLTDTQPLGEVIPRFLDVVRQTFDAAAAELALTIDGRIVRHRLHEVYAVDDSGANTTMTLLLQAMEPAAIETGRPDPASSMLHREGWRNCLAAPLVGSDDVTGMLCVYDRSGHEGFEQGELAVLTALGAEASGAIVRTMLLDRLLREQRMLADVVASTTDGIFAIDRDARILMWNPGIEAISGHSALEVLGTQVTAALLPRDRDGRAVMLEKGVSDGAAPSDLQIRTRSGHTRWVTCSYTRLPATDERPASLVVVARDVTRQRELDRLKEDFVATISHELRTPLTPIKGWAETLVNLGERMQPADRLSAAESILRQANGLERLISNLLEVARIERGVIDLREDIVDLRAIVDEVIRQCHAVEPARPILIDAPDMPVRARGDAVWMERIVCNLLSNAVRYSPDDTPIEIRLAMEDGHAEIAITDAGPGIAPEQHERIFERFTRLGDHLTRTTGGAGLGLYIARQLARGLGGTVSVRSDLGQGSTFTFSLQAVDAPASVTT
jgi:PAS domain S-box-containing protein